MTAEANVSIICEATGLGKLLQFCEKFATTTAPTALTYNYRVYTAAANDIGEVLDLGDVTTVHLIIIKAIDKRLYIDTSYSAAFSNEIDLQIGEVAIFKPVGIVWVKNYTTAETPAYEYLCIGVT